MQSLSESLHRLNRFLASQSERALPFFNTLKNITKENKHEYRWTPEAEEAFQQMKRLIISLPSLTPPFPKETLYAYLAVAKEAVSGVLLTDRNGRQCPSTHPVKISCRCSDGEAEEEYFRMPEVPPEVDDTEVWTLFTDGAASLKGSGAGLVLIGPSGLEYTYALRLTFVSTNNEAEYEALLAGLRIARKMKVSSIEVKNSRVFIETLPREDNQKADILSKLATVPFSHLTKEILVEVLNERSTDAKEVQTIVEEEGENWMTPIINYLEEGIVPSDKNEARSLRAKISQYVIESGVCFKKGYLVPDVEAKSSGQEAQCGQGYYGPHCMYDAKKEVDKCDSCQIHSPIPRLPKTHMTSIMAPCPFYQWGMDILGPLTPARGGAKFVFVAIGYFTKWIRKQALVKNNRTLEHRMEDEGKLGTKLEGPYRLLKHSRMAHYNVEHYEDRWC
ncbi:reverse transcriptase domain-containing protein [Tanacetum coccineum]